MWEAPQKNRFLLLIFLALCTQLSLIFVVLSCYNSWVPTKTYFLVKMGRASNIQKTDDILVQNQNNYNAKISIASNSRKHNTSTPNDVKNQSKLLNISEKIDAKDSNVISNYQLPARDYNQLMNLTNFKFTLMNNEGCSTEDVSKNPFLLILVISSPSNNVRRKIVRETWGNVTGGVKLVFLLAGVDEKLQNLVNEENEIYKDIVQGNFLDSYRNLTYKTVMSLKYVVYHCPFAKYVLKIDDDAFANMPLLIHFLKNQISPNGTNNLLICDVLLNKKPYRYPASKWYVSIDDFPEEQYPTYCPGWVAIFSPDSMFKLYREAQKTKYFWLEDVFLYGIVARNVPGLKHTDMTGLTTTWCYPDKFLKHVYGNMTFLFGGPDFSNQLLIDFWHYIQDHNELMFKNIDTLWTFIQSLPLKNATDNFIKTWKVVQNMAHHKDLGS